MAQVSDISGFAAGQLPSYNLYECERSQNFLDLTSKNHSAKPSTKVQCFPGTPRFQVEPAEFWTSPAEKAPAPQESSNCLYKSCRALLERTAGALLGLRIAEICYYPGGFMVVSWWFDRILWNV